MSFTIYSRYDSWNSFSTFVNNLNCFLDLSSTFPQRSG